MLKVRHAIACTAALFAATAYAAGDASKEAQKQQQGAQQQGQQQQIQAAQMSEETIRKIQQALNDKGFDAGPVDGVWGPLTQRALRNFQESQDKLQASGNLNQQTLAALGIESAGQASTGGTAATGGSGAKQGQSAQKQKDGAMKQNEKAGQDEQKARRQKESK